MGAGLAANGSSDCRSGTNRLNEQIAGPSAWSPSRAYVRNARLRPRDPRQSADRHRPLLLALLSLVPAADVPPVAEDVRGVVRRTRPRHHLDVGRVRPAADAGRLLGRPLRRAAVPRRWHLADDLVDGGDELRHGLLADPDPGAVLGH